MRLTKSFKVAPDDSGVSSFTGYASTWTRTPDVYGDVVAKGAFSESLEEWKQSGKVIPVLWLHDQYNPASYVAKVVDIVEDDHGLKVTGEFFDDEVSRKVHRLVKERMVNEMSFAFDIVDSAMIDVDGMRVRELRKVDLYECSIVPQGANSDTSIDAVKAVQDRFTDEEIAALKELAAGNLATPRVEADNKPDEAPEAGNPEDSGEAVSKSQGEVVARISKTIDALSGKEGV